jgi:hypothetical protein
VALASLRFAVTVVSAYRARQSAVKRVPTIARRGQAVGD